MINREMQSVYLLTYSDEPDEYGQLRTSAPTATPIDMVCKIYVQGLTNDMRYVDVEMIGITKYKDITDKNEIMINNITYTVMYIIPSSRYYQILMKKK